MDSETPWCFGGRGTMKVSAVQIVLGLACVAAGIAGSVWDAWFEDTGYGIWSGILFVMTGAAGIQAAKDWKPCWILCFLITSALSGLVAICVVLPLSFVALGEDKLDTNRLAVDCILMVAAALQGILSAATFFMAFCGCCTVKGRKSSRQTPAVGVMDSGESQRPLATVGSHPYLQPSPVHDNGTTFP
ncbi:uncharacterized protein LOC144928986 [Branchiostoma floridae x Branchiostoma belcheri]